jgi:Family of unknown function (DUF5677)
MSDWLDSEALENGRSLVRVCEPVVTSISELEWNPKMGFWTVLCRCVLRRQYDALKTIVDLVANGHAHSAVPLLRPACEELLWLAFLRRLDPEIREAIIVAKSQIEVSDTVEAQLSEMVTGGLQELGFRTDFVRSIRHGRTGAEETIAAVGKTLNWRLRNGKYQFPTVRMMARTTGHNIMYSVVYHSTSRTVHFSVAELFRRAWGDKRLLRITSNNMNRYWARFALYWGFGIFALTLLEIAEEFEKNDWPIGDVSDTDEFERLVDEWGSAGKIPIITPEEMNQHLAPGESAFGE